MVPLTLFGSFTGVIISSILPDAVLTILICLLMVYLTYDSFTKAFQLWRKENLARKAKKEKIAATPEALASAFDDDRYVD
jgi:uncharacterized membrane protein YfcA